MKKQEVSVTELRKERVEAAHKILEKAFPDSFIGELNDNAYYLVIRNPKDAQAAKALLEEQNIQAEIEYREQINDAVLFIQDEEKTEEEENV